MLVVFPENEPVLYRFVTRLLGAVVLIAASQQVAAAVPFDPALQVLPAEVSLPRWEYAQDAIATDTTRLQACLADEASCPSPRLRSWRALVKGLVERPPPEQLAAVDRFINSVPYAADAEHYGKRDHWSGPWNFLQSRGDCEDYAIAKYLTLRLLGFAIDDLRILVVEDVERDLAHAVLAVRTDEGVMLLDNQADAPIPAAAQQRYEPYYAVNEHSRWLHRLPSRARTAAGR